MRTPAQARQLASAYNIPLRANFHALASDTVARINEAADSWRYRKPLSANGSRARYFHAFLCRLANREESE